MKNLSNKEIKEYFENNTKGLRSFEVSKQINIFTKSTKINVTYVNMKNSRRLTHTLLFKTNEDIEHLLLTSTSNISEKV